MLKLYFQLLISSILGDRVVWYIERSKCISSVENGSKCYLSAEKGETFTQGQREKADFY